ncbi:MAG: tRNA pseudouridine(38-40) synthase TruA [Actinomycetota bacterium]|nr:tRNA pseudouridine(38-40) synthase TruA [Actinomycetota bacterium]
MRVRFDISYDGTDFSGWAVQPGRRTVQGELQGALATVLRRPFVTLTVAGRTDAGVHASGQVAHADLPPGSLAGLPAHLSGVLPPDVRVPAIGEVPADFDARFSALWRRYEYRISDDPSGASPLHRRFVLDHRRPLDARVMADAASGLVGLHEFAAFCKRRASGSTIRTLEQFEVRRVGPEIVCTIQADAFCRSMVRSLVGALIAVGQGHRPPDWPAGLLARDTRVGDVSVAPARGLTLTEVGYPPDDKLAARATVTRVRR